MGIIYLIVILILVIILASIIDKFVPRVPEPLIQIFLGAIISTCAIYFLSDKPIFFDILSTEEFIIKPELFLALFIAPILYREAEEADILEINSLKKEIVFMAFALVFITCIGIGFIFHMIFPFVPLAACFALGAILGPIDAVSVFAFTKNMNIKSSALAILKGEGLINDASGIVAFQFSIAALLTGGFSFVIAGGELVLISVGGLIIGVILGVLKNYLHKFFKVIHEKNELIYIFSEIAMPFLCYIIAEKFHTSGIIAAVSAGAVSSFRTDSLSLFNAKISEMRTSIWKMFLYALNGIVFIILGLELPDILADISKIPEFYNIKVLIAPIVITIVLLIIRFIFVLFFASHKELESRKDKLWNAAFLTISGPKGSVSLAIAFSLPLTILGNPFMSRPLLLFTTAICIVLTLIVTAIFLPILAKKDEAAILAKRKQTVHLLNEIINELNKRLDYKDSMTAVLHYKKRIEEISKSIKRSRVNKELRTLRGIYWEVGKDVFKEKIKKSHSSKKELRVLNKISKIQKEYSRHKSLINISARLRKRVNFDAWLLTDTEKKSISQERLIDLFFELNAEIFTRIEEKYPDFSYSALEKLLDHKIDLGGQAFESFYDVKLHEKFSEKWTIQMLIAFDIDRELVKKYLLEDKIDFATADRMRIAINEIEKYTIEEKDNTAFYRLLGSRMQRRRNIAKKRKAKKEQLETLVRNYTLKP